MRTQARNRDAARSSTLAANRREREARRGAVAQRASAGLPAKPAKRISSGMNAHLTMKARSRSTFVKPTPKPNREQLREEEAAHRADMEQEVRVSPWSYHHPEPDLLLERSQTISYTTPGFCACRFSVGCSLPHVASTWV